MDFEWDDRKAEINLKKHGIRFSEAVTVWLDSLALEMPDLDHSQTEDRWIRLGFTGEARILVVIYVEKIDGERIRIISARKATRSESQQYDSR